MHFISIYQKIAEWYICDLDYTRNLHALSGLKNRPYVHFSLRLHIVAHWLRVIVYHCFQLCFICPTACNAGWIVWKMRRDTHWNTSRTRLRANNTKAHNVKQSGGLCAQMHNRKTMRNNCAQLFTVCIMSNNRASIVLDCTCFAQSKTMACNGIQCMWSHLVITKRDHIML